MAGKILLTDKFCRSDKRIPSEGRAFYWDTQVPGLALRATATGDRGFYLVRRYPGSAHPAARLVAKLGELDLALVRDKAREWNALLQKGIDPRVEQQRQKAAEASRQAATLAALLDEYYEAEGHKLAKAGELARAIAAFKSYWPDRLAAEMLPVEIAAHIRSIAKRTPSEARNRFAHLSRAFSRAVGMGALNINPCRQLTRKDLVGPKLARDRVLSDEELRAIWNATSGPADASALTAARARDPARAKPDALGYPWAGIVRLLALTGARLDMIAGLRWHEVDFGDAVITFGAARMKTKAAFELPLPADGMTMRLLRSLPRIGECDAVFTTDGKGPVYGFGSAVKRKLDALSGVDDWVLHDVRRTCRTRWSALPVEDVTRELAMAHAQKGMHAVYDRHSRRDEKRELFLLWELKLAGILAPKPPAGVADLTKARARLAA